MATASSALTPPPGMDDQSQQNPTSPAAASPAPPEPAQGMQAGTQMVIGVVSGLRAIAKAFPATAPDIAQINDLMRQVMAKMMSSQQTGEPAAPPQGG
jgi:hypothetical protein